MSYVTIEDVKDALQLELVAGREGLGRKIYVSDISRPALEMTGYFDFYMADRVQLLGKTELSFFEKLDKDVRLDRIQKLCAPSTPVIIAANGMEVPPEIIEVANEVHITVLKTDVPTTKFFIMLTNYLEGQLAPMTTLHGVLVDVYGIGVLLTGKSGVGKSETALELVKRGHRLVADDLVEIRQVSKNVLIGNAPKLIEHMLEIRGVGIIDMMTLFGASSFRANKRILMVIDLEFWDEKKMYDRLGLDEVKMKIIDTELIRLTVPVRPGRNLSVIIEVAAMDYRLKRLGVNAAEEFSKKLDNVIESSVEGDL